MPKSDLPARRGPQHLLERILDTPNLAQVVPQLPAEMLHRVIEHCGLEDCGEIVALATPAQLARVFDLDLWRPAQPGQDDQFDADRFGVWLEVLMESGAESAAQKLAAMDANLVITTLSQHALVFDGAAVSSYTTTDGEEMPAARNRHDAPSREVGSYLIVAKREDSWDAIVAVLAALEETHHDVFRDVMDGCRALSNSGYELDGLDDLLADSDQGLFDLSIEREQRREQQGYATPAEARAFLQMARELQLGHASPPRPNPVVLAYFRGIESSPAESDATADAMPDPDVADSVADILEVLTEAGIMPAQQPPRALLGGQQKQEEPAPRLSRMQAQMQVAHERNHAAYSMRTEELAYLTNAIAAGCSIQERPFTVQEASDAAAAVCNLGLENWPARWLEAPARPMPNDFLVAHDLVTVFQVGWAILHRDVSMYAAEQLIDVLTHLSCDDRETRSALNVLRKQMARHCKDGTPGKARDAMEVLAILDAPAWVALLGLIDDCPVLHAGIGASRNSRTRSVRASDFEFISENSQIALVRNFMASLPETLRG
jgi:hypothetical protein